MVVITCRVITRTESVVCPGVPGIRRNTILQFGQVLQISGPGLLLLTVQTVQTDVLHRT